MMTYSQMQMDALKEIINIGGGHAATSISKLVNQRVDMDVPRVAVQDYDEIYETVLEDDQEVYAISCPIEGDFEGIFLFVMSNDAANHMSNLMMGSTEQLPHELKVSALQELTNIVSNSFLHSITDFLGIHVVGALPSTKTDYFGAILSSIYLAYEQYDDQILCIHNDFEFEHMENLDISLFLVPSINALDTIFQAIGLNKGV